MKILVSLVYGFNDGSSTDRDVGSAFTFPVRKAEVKICLFRVNDRTGYERTLAFLLFYTICMYPSHMYCLIAHIVTDTSIGRDCVVSIFALCICIYKLW